MEFKQLSYPTDEGGESTANRRKRLTLASKNDNLRIMADDISKCS